jgi:hypothetical protein
MVIGERFCFIARESIEYIVGIVGDSSISESFSGEVKLVVGIRIECLCSVLYLCETIEVVIRSRDFFSTWVCCFCQVSQEIVFVCYCVSII